MRSGVVNLANPSRVAPLLGPLFIRCLYKHQPYIRKHLFMQSTQAPTQQSAILITGAGHRVGAQIARQLLSAGFSVLLHAHRETEFTAQMRAQSVPVLLADFSNEQAIQALIAAVRSHGTALRGIIHNASAFARSDTDLTSAAKQFELFYSMHMLAPMMLSEALADHLFKYADDSSSAADIISITDIFADRPNPAFDLYCASKAGLQNLSISWAKKWAPRIKVNVIQPGPILFQPWHSDAVKNAVLNETLLQKEGGAEVIAQAVLALLNNPYQTGSIIAVDGGRRWA